MNKIFDKKRNLLFFENINQYMDYLEKTPRVQRSSDSEDGSKYFTGTSSYSEAFKLCKFGDEDLAKKVRTKVASYDGNLKEVERLKKELINSVVGFMPNVPLFCIGVPNNMIGSKNVIYKTRVINILINCCANACVDAKDIEKICSTYVAAVDQLEKQGYRCNVYAATVGTGIIDGNNVEKAIIVRVKTDKEPMNLAKIAFPLCHPSFLRRLGFRAIETMPINFCSYGYGRTCYDKERIKSIIKDIMPLDVKKLVVLAIDKNDDNESIVKVMENIKQKGGDDD